MSEARCECAHSQEEHGPFCGECLCEGFRPGSGDSAPSPRPTVAPTPAPLAKAHYRDLIRRTRDLLADLEDRWLAGRSLKASLADIRAMRRELSLNLPEQEREL